MKSRAGTFISIQEANANSIKLRIRRDESTALKQLMEGSKHRRTPTVMDDSIATKVN